MSEESITKLIVALVPLMQTAVWAVVAVSVIILLRKPIQNLAVQLASRVNDGDTLSTPWLTIERREDRERQVVQQVTESVKLALPDGDGAENGNSSDRSKIDQLIDDVGNRFIEVVFPYPDFKGHRTHPTRISMYLTNWGSVSEFSDDVYFAAHQQGIQLPAYRYGTYWQLINQRIGSPVLKEDIDKKEDHRPFDVLDIQAGDTLLASRV